jgi:Do/DeqQ family serine protease
MKQTIRLLVVALVAGALTLGGYTLLIEDNTPKPIQPTAVEPVLTSHIATFASAATANENADLNFVDAAEKTVNAVVHVTNTTYSRQATSLRELFFGGGQPRAMIGTGSGVIISPDGYIITNNHVIDNSSALEVTLNDNRSFEARLIGTDPKTDIALIKIDSDTELPFIPFADSNSIRVGEWVLAVGNPFNLTSTVTAGIVSAKARDLNEWDGNPQSFIQTDAAVNRGNSGGALVNTRGELVGINTAITSETGSYVGYSFAVPSNVARKVVEDIMEYGDVQRGILGITGGSLNSRVAGQYGLDETEGVYVSSVERGSGAENSGLKPGDIIRKIDNVEISKFSDLSGYLGGKRPNDVVDVTVIREGGKRTIPVTLIKLETYQIQSLDLEVKNISQEELNDRGVDHGVKVVRSLSNKMAQYDLEGIIITDINNQPIEDINDVQQAMNRRGYDDPIKLSFVDLEGKSSSVIFR